MRANKLAAESLREIADSLEEKETLQPFNIEYKAPLEDVATIKVETEIAVTATEIEKITNPVSKIDSIGYSEK